MSRYGAECGALIPGPSASGVLDRLIRELGDKAMVEFAPRMEGNTMHAILVPAKKDVKPVKPAKVKPPQAPPSSQQAPPTAQQA